MATRIVVVVGLLATVAAVAVTFLLPRLEARLEASAKAPILRQNTLMLLFILIVTLIPLVVLIVVPNRAGTTPPTTVTITSPPEEAYAPLEVTVEGRVSSLGASESVWILVHPLSDGRLYPQGVARVQPDGNWTSLIFLGSSKDNGERFAIIAATVNPQAHQELERYMARGVESGNFPGLAALPVGAVERAEVQVTRT
jgi:hypothetical protein